MALKRPDLDAIRQAHQRIKPHIHRTPVLKSAAVDDICGAEVLFKCENLQKVGAFKARGAWMRKLPPEALSPIPQAITLQPWPTQPHSGESLPT